MNGINIVLIVNILNIVVPLLVSVLIAYLLIELSRRNRVLEKVTERVRETLSEERTIIRRQEEEKLQRLEGNREKKKLLYRIDEMLVQSGIRKVIPIFTTELFLTMLIILSVLSLYVTYVITGEMIFGVIVVMLLIMSSYLCLRVLLIRNKSKLDDGILQFANMLENYSRTTDDIVSIFGKIVYYLDEPLKSAVGECYTEISTTGNIPTAFARLDAKIGHRQLSDLLQNIEICSRHETNYEEVIKGNKQLIKNYLAEKVVRKQMANDARFKIIGLLAASVLVLSTINGIIDGHLLEYMMQSLGGKLILCYASGVLLYSIWKCITMGQEE